MSRVARALTALGVPITTILDFDVLNADSPLSEIVASVGGRWSEFEQDWRRLKQEIDTAKPALKVTQIKQEVNRILDEEAAANLTEEGADKIRAVLKSVSAWDQPKQTGLATLTGGKLATAEALLAGLAQVGVAVVPCGELEGFVPHFATTKCRGSKFVAKVLREITDLAADEKLQRARTFMTEIYRKLADEIAGNQDQAPN